MRRRIALRKDYVRNVPETWSRFAKLLENARVLASLFVGAALQSKIEEPVLSDSRTDRKPKIPEWEVLPPENRQSRKLSGLEPLFKWLAIIMDGLLRLPGTKFRFGLNPLIDFVPGIGDVSAAFVSTSVLIYAVTRGLPKILLARMALNILINELVGILPVVGSAFAFWFRANKRNYDLLQRHLELPIRSRKSDWVFVGAVLGLVFVIICAGLIVSLLVLQAIGRLIFGQ